MGPAAAEDERLVSIPFWRQRITRGLIEVGSKQRLMPHRSW
jgi:hypothetical protein